MSDEVPQPPNIVSDSYKDGYDEIDWDKPYERAPVPVPPVSHKRTTSTVSSSRPHISSNAAIHRDQVKAFNKQCAHGTHYREDGKLESTSYRAREREARRRNLSFN